MNQTNYAVHSLNTIVYCLNCVGLIKSGEKSAWLVLSCNLQTQPTAQLRVQAR